MAIEPLGMASTLSPPVAPSFMIEPFPNCFSICRIAASIALVFSVTATSSSQTRIQKTNGAGLLSHRRRLNFSREPLPVDLFLALGLHDLERHGLHGGRGAALPLQLALELFLGLLLDVLVFGLSATAWHLRPPVRWKHPDTTSIPVPVPILTSCQLRGARAPASRPAPATAARRASSASRASPRRIRASRRSASSTRLSPSSA